MANAYLGFGLVVVMMIVAMELMKMIVNIQAVQVKSSPVETMDVYQKQRSDNGCEQFVARKKTSIRRP